MSGNVSRDYVAFIESISNIDRSTFPNDVERYAALDAARELCMRLETSVDHIVYQNVCVPTTQMAVRTLLNMGVLHKLVERTKSAWTTSELAVAVDSDPTFLSRLLKHAAANNVIVETDVNAWTANRYTHDLTKREVGSAMDFLYEMIWPSYSKAPEYFAKTSYKNPVSTTEGVWQYATDTAGASIFSYLNARPQMHKNFMDFMSGYTFRKQKWTDIYPTKELFSKYEGGPLIVDVGGGVGSDLKIFLGAHPEASGRLVLQDQVDVIKNLQDAQGITSMVHDFFTPQPIEGARVYLLHAVCHDWPDEECVSILKQLKPAMSSNYSKVLVVDCVIPTKGAHQEATSQDISMMNITGAWERTEEQWSAMFKTAGFKISSIHPGRLESVIEAEAE